MEFLTNKKKYTLLPVYFKKIGIVVILLSFLPLIIVKTFDIELIKSQKELFKTLTLNILILGLVFIAWSRDKIEDEMTMSIRLSSMAWTFLWAVLLVVIKPLFDFLFYGTSSEFTAQPLVIMMLFYYLFVYYQKKRAR
jgi:hypothetical protein